MAKKADKQSDDKKTAPKKNSGKKDSPEDDSEEDDNGEGPSGQPSSAKGKGPARGGRGAHKGRTLVRWDNDMDVHLLLVIQQVCNATGYKLPWVKIAEAMGPKYTDSGIIQHISKLRIRRKNEGKPVPPLLRCAMKKAGMPSGRAPRKKSEKIAGGGPGGSAAGTGTKRKRAIKEESSSEESSDGADNREDPTYRPKRSKIVKNEMRPGGKGGKGSSQSAQSSSTGAGSSRGLLCAQAPFLKLKDRDDVSTDSEPSFFSDAYSEEDDRNEQSIVVALRVDPGALENLRLTGNVRPPMPEATEESLALASRPWLPVSREPVAPNLAGITSPIMPAMGPMGPPPSIPGSDPYLPAWDATFQGYPMYPGQHPYQGQQGAEGQTGSHGQTGPNSHLGIYGGMPWYPPPSPIAYDSATTPPSHGYHQGMYQYPSQGRGMAGDSSQYPMAFPGIYGMPYGMPYAMGPFAMNRGMNQGNTFIGIGRGSSPLDADAMTPSMDRGMSQMDEEMLQALDRGINSMGQMPQRAPQGMDRGMGSMSQTPGEGDYIIGPSILDPRLAAMQRAMGEEHSAYHGSDGTTSEVSRRTERHVHQSVDNSVRKPVKEEPMEEPAKQPGENSEEEPRCIEDEEHEDHELFYGLKESSSDGLDKFTRDFMGAH
ncbi:hypothetical protein N7520_010443 [Penicillium odoratum]|uniref:uncharacterized protein n=1 Tax=Penicillium odoratum TaxID=1167516 RepID=UPI0025477F0B|nr:uncharacterized protein N7520_010443 [Penicillium odoratum]KAJ5745261.1 hypothetical protein N7520_010443 [Penicillium odoratum]